MVSIVIVSHSAQIAAGVQQLAAQMVKEQVQIATAGGTDNPENPIGTDPLQVLAAIEEVYSEDGVVVLMDLGSALLSAETALEFLPPEQRENVFLCAAPLVEGTLAAAVQASVGGSAQEVITEAIQALAAKQVQFGSIGHPAPEAPEATTAESDTTHQITLTITNRQGLHARPAAQFVTTASSFNANLTVQKGERQANAKSINQLATLGARRGDTITVLASGPQATEALTALEALVKANFGEEEELEVAVETPVEAPAGDTDHIWAGIAASPGVAIGPVALYQPQLPEVEQRTITDPAAEWKRLEQAIHTARQEIETLQEEAVRRVGANEAAILGAHTLILQDPVLLTALRARIYDERMNAEAAWQLEMRSLAASFEALDDAYMQARVVDVRDVAERVLGQLMEREPPSLHFEQPVILVAADLTPSDTVRLDTTQVLGICTERGGANSHSAILARALGIPAVVGVGPVLWQLTAGQLIALDGQQGKVWAHPTEEEMQRLQQQARDWQEAWSLTQAAAEEQAVLKGGQAVEIAANIGRPQDVVAALQNGAEGVGLFRTEFLFLGRQEAPNEEEQLAAYREVAEKMGNRPVIIRTLDVGGDKTLPYLSQAAEDNPFLGQRGIRFTLARPALLKTQLRAILRASHGHNIKVMFPMVATVAEVQAAKTLLLEAQEELRAEGHPFQEELEVGIMIEVPAAVLLADHLARHVDFFSIGTNDLAQYVMAADRGNRRVATLADPLDPAVLRMVAQTVQAGHAAGIWVGMCGELAGNVDAAPILVGLGLDELSMNASAIPAVKAVLRTLTLEEAQQVAQKALQLDSASAVLEYLHSR